MLVILKANATFRNTQWIFLKNFPNQEILKKLHENIEPNGPKP